MEKLELLEEKIRKATDLIRTLREDRTVLTEQLRSARDEVKRLSLKKEDTESHARIEKMQKERMLLGQRIERMISIIEEVEAS